MTADLPIEVATQVRDGHTFGWDPPSALTAARRWTCTACGDAVLDYRGNVYGGATERTCPGGAR